MKRNTYFIIGAVVLMVVAIVMIVIGVSTHEEPTLISPENSWERTPLLVSCQLYGVTAHESPEARRENDRACQTVWDVIETVNIRLGFQMLSMTGDVGGVIHVSMRSPVEVGMDGPGGHFDLVGTGTEYERCEIRTMNVSGGASDLEWLTVYHEIGHCLGLAHDDYRQSIMFPTQEPTPDRTLPPWISDFDRAALREKYHR